MSLKRKEEKRGRGEERCEEICSQRDRSIQGSGGTTAIATHAGAMGPAAEWGPPMGRQIGAL